MLKSLIIIRFRFLYTSLFRNQTNKNSLKSGKTKKVGGKVTKVLLVLLMIYAYVAVGFAVGMMLYEIAKAFLPTPFAWLYYSFAAIAAFALSFVGSIFATQSQLFDSRDNNLLLSMPVPPAYILASRLISVVLVNMFFCSIIYVPAGVVVCILGHVTAVGVVMYILTAILISLLSVVLSCIFGWLIAWISSKMKNKNLISLIFSLVFLFAYFFLYPQAYSYIQVLIKNGSDVADAIRRAMFPFYCAGVAVADTKVVEFLILAAISIVCFAAIYAILSASFIRIVSANRGRVSTVYREKRAEQNSPLAALTKREMRRFFGNYMYIMNAGLGLIFAIIVIVAAAVKYNDIQAFIAGFGQTLPEGYIDGALGGAIALLNCGLASTCTISAPSISLEGKNLWIIQSLPVGGSTIFLAKAMSHFVIAAPVLAVSSLSLSIMFNVGFLPALIAIFVPICFTAFMSLFGIFANMKFHNFNYVSDIAAIKQSISVLITMLGSMAVIAVPIIFSVLGFKGGANFSVNTIALLLGAATLVLAGLIFAYIKARGDRVLVSFSD